MKKTEFFPSQFQFDRFCNQPLNDFCAEYLIALPFPRNTVNR